MSRKYGWKPDLPDHRDRLYLKRSVKKLPVQIDLRKQQTPVYDQLSLGSCTANSIASLIDYVHIKNKFKPIYPSRLFIYYNERVLENSIDEDAGAEIRDGIKTVVKDGVCKESEWPYDIGKFKIKPSEQCYKNALLEQTLEYRRLNNLNDYKGCLAEGNCFVFGFTVYDYFESEEMSQTGILKLPNSTETPIGGHAVYAVGYSDKKNSFIVKNSWGSNWGIKGYFYMPYEYISNVNLCDDFWTITKVE